MKLVNKLTIVATVASFMFAGMNLTWGNAYTNNADDLAVANQFGVWLDVNDSMAFGWEGDGIKVGFGGPAGMTVRLGYDTTADGEVGSTLGMSRTWWTSTGDGWGTNLSTALDFNMTGGAGAGFDAGDWTLTMNLGFGF
tara:strand:- start:243 stop:659 length:417 start_codon:yes stop_codon:yes gene_type:complete